MAGEHIYSSSLFIQSGAIAQFKSGISSSGLNIQGNIFAEGYFNTLGQELSTVGGVDNTVFFAGNSSGVSESIRSSKDTFIEITTANADPSIPTADIINIGEIKIETTSSGDFKPNFFNFLKVGALDENLRTVQQGGLDQQTYIPETEEERSGGVHKYIIFAAQTGSNGRTFQVFHTVTLATFVNTAPTLLPQSDVFEDSSNIFVINFDHDSNNSNLVLHFTESTDPNQVAGDSGNDFIKSFTASRLTIDPTTVNATTNSFTLTLDHVNSSEIIPPSPDDNSGLQTIQITQDSPGLADTSLMHFTASVVSYVATQSDGTNTISSSKNQFEEFRVNIKDTYLAEATRDYTLVVTPPPTASIQDIAVQFEEDGFTNKLVDANTTYNHTILYNFTSSLDSGSIAPLNDRYTSSLIRAQILADIQSPVNSGGTIPSTIIKILSSSTDNNITNSDETIGFFQFNNSNTASFSSSTIDGTYGALESNNFISIIAKEGTGFYGVNTSLSELNNINSVRHGINNHYEVLDNNLRNSTQLVVNKCPNVFISDITMEVESGSFGGGKLSPGHNELTSSLLYGFTSSLSSSLTSSFINDIVGTGHTNYDRYISQSIVRLRVKAKITEPFGPSHNAITASIKQLGAVSNTTFIVNPEDHPILFGNNNNLRNGSFDISSQLSDTSISTIRITRLELQGDLGGANEYLGNFIIGGVNLGNIGMLNSSNDNSAVFTDAASGINSSERTETITGNNGIDISINNGVIDLEYEPNEASYTTFNPPITYNGVNQSYGIRITFEDPNSSTSLLDGHKGNEFHFTIPSTILPVANSSIFGETVDAFTHKSIAKASASYTTNHNHPDASQTGKELLVTSYTSSYIEVLIPEGSFDFITTFESSSEVFNVGGTLDNDNSQSVSITMSSTPPIRYENLVYENETHGYSNDSILNTTRNVLYGNAHFTDTDSSSYSNHPRAVAFASQSVSRFRVRGTIIEPFGVALATSSIQLKATSENNVVTIISGGTDPDTNNSVLIQNKFENSNVINVDDLKVLSSSVSNYSSSGELVTIFTSSWISQSILLDSSFQNNISTPEDFTISGSLISTFDSKEFFNQQSRVISNTPTQGTLTIRDTDKVKFTNLVYRSETSGYSYQVNQGSAGLFAFRRVLYGVASKTLADSSSFEGHESASRFASQSVSRFLIQADVIEPVGPLHNSFTLNALLTNLVDSNKNEEISISITTQSFDGDVLFGYNLENKLTSSYTSSFIGKELSVTKGSQDIYTFDTNNVTNFPLGEQTSATLDSSDNNFITIKDTEPISITIKNVDIETFGESGIKADFNTTDNTPLVGLFSDTHVRSILNNESLTRSTGSSLNSSQISSSVLKTNMEVTIVEPLGPLHTASLIATLFDPVNDGTNQSGPFVKFATNSNSVSSFNKTKSSLGGFDHQYTYVSNFTGSEIPALNNEDKAYNMTVDSSTVIQPATEENGITLVNNNLNNFIAIKPSSSDNQIIDLKIEIETTSGSGTTFGSGGTQRTSRTTNILHGKHGSEINPEVNNGYPDSDDREQLVGARVLATIQETLGVTHLDTTIAIGGQNNIQSITFNTSSNNTEVSSSSHPSDSGLLVKYTSSFFPLPFSASANTPISITQLDPNGNEQTITRTISASVLSMESVPFIDFNSNTIDVTAIGAKSSSITISKINTGSNNLSSSVFNSGEDETLYYQYHENLDQFESDTIKFVPEYTVIPPTFTSESNLKFPNNLEINFTLTSNTALNTSITSNPSSDGTASISFLNFINLENIKNPLEFSLNSIVEDKEQGSGIDSKIRKFFILPARPATMSGDFGSFHLVGHPTSLTESFYEGTLVSQSLLNYSGSGSSGLLAPINPGFNSGKEVSSSRIYMVSASLDRLSYNSLTLRNNVHSPLFDVSAATSVTSPSSLSNLDSEYFTSTDEFFTRGADVPFEVGGGFTPLNKATGIILHSHLNGSASYFGNYSNNNRAFSHGDKGSLSILINGGSALGLGGINLTGLFDPSLKHTNQVTSENNSYNVLTLLRGGGGGFSDPHIVGAFPLTINENGIGQSGNNVSTIGVFYMNNTRPFNNVSQSVSSSGEAFPNGFQAFDFSIWINEKIRQGHNTIEVVHEYDTTINGIETSVTRSLNTFEWYYNEGINFVKASNQIGFLGGAYTSASIKTGENMSYTNENNAIHSLSGVSYFKVNTPFTASINNIFNLANKVYPDNTAIAFTKKLDTGVTITGDNQTLSNVAGTLDHEIHNISSDPSIRRGLRFHEDEANFIPTAESTASIKLEIRAVTLPNNSVNINPTKGDTIDIQHFVRQKDSSSIDGYNDRLLVQNTIGRFMYSGSALNNYIKSTDSSSCFFEENTRWSSASLEESASLNPEDMNGFANDFRFWLSSSNANYDSIQDISSTQDLQQTYEGRLRYPSESYAVVNPNSVDYSSVTGERYYFKAFQLPLDQINSGTLTFDVFIHGNFIESDIFDQNNPNTNSDLNIRIDVRTPGLIKQVGSFWGVINQQFGVTDVEGNGGYWCAHQDRSFDSENGFIRFGVNMRQRPPFFTNGVILLKVIYRSTLD